MHLYPTRSRKLPKSQAYRLKTLKRFEAGAIACCLYNQRDRLPNFYLSNAIAQITQITGLSVEEIEVL